MCVCFESGLILIRRIVLSPFWFFCVFCFSHPNERVCVVFILLYFVICSLAYAHYYAWLPWHYHPNTIFCLSLISISISLIFGCLFCQRQEQFTLLSTYFISPLVLTIIPHTFIIYWYLLSFRSLVSYLLLALHCLLCWRLS
jgi:membrane-associated HD superfamily phosphohydrolase